MTYYFKDQNQYSLAPSNSIDISEKLPGGIYILKYNKPYNKFYLELTGNFSISDKLYGNTEKLADRILNTFYSRNSSTGAMFTGEKGSGKTLLAKLISTKAVSNNYPVILVNEQFKSSEFCQFIKSIDQECIVFFDEFEKIYSSEGSAGDSVDTTPQDSMLTLFDGVYSSKKLFLLTCNDTRKLSSFLKNRPGRMYYNINFDRLDEDFISEYCADRLTKKEHKESVIIASVLFSGFNFDILQCLVEEMNRYGEPASECLKYMNIKPEYDTTYSTYSFRAYNADNVREKISIMEGYQINTHFNPLVSNIPVYIKLPNKAEQRIAISPDLIKSYDSKTKEFIYACHKGIEIVATPEEHKGIEIVATPEETYTKKFDLSDLLV